MTRFSTPRTTPPPVATPMAVEPSLIASREYSTWKRRPSGEKVLNGRLDLARMVERLPEKLQMACRNILDTTIYLDD